jgi:hypothetical protein
MSKLLADWEWNAALENELFNSIIAVRASHLPQTPVGETREPETPEEISSCKPARAPSPISISIRIFS